MNSFSFDSKDGDIDTIFNDEDELIARVSEDSRNKDRCKSLLNVPTENLPIFATESQAKVIEFPPEMNKILVVKAGPGSGKTSTIVKRIAYLISLGQLKPDEILVLSMANRSVNALKKYLINTLGEDLTNGISINTFHSFCGGLVDQYGDQYSSSFKKKTLMDDLSWRSFSNIFLGKSISLSGRTVEGNLTPPSLEKLLISVKSGNLTIPQAAYKYKVSKEYIEALIMYLESNGMIRYHDLLVNALELMDLSLQPQVEGSKNLIPQLKNYKAVIVDEFQDIHPQLLLVVKAVIEYPTSGFDKGDIKHLTIAGDPNQSIYEFLGSRPELIHKIQLEIPGTEVIQLPINESFRITPEILNAVTEICLKPAGLYDPSHELRSIRDHGYKPIISEHTSNRDEYAFIASEITRLICELGGLLKPSDFAILTRSNKEIEEISKFLTQTYNIKCNRFSLSALWIKSKVHILLDILNVINKGPSSDFGLLCVISILDQKFGSSSRVSKLFNLSNKWKISTGLQTKENALEEYMIHQLELLDIQAEKKEVTANKNKNSLYDIKNIYKLPKYSDEVLRLKSFMDSIQSVRRDLVQNNQDLQNPTRILSSLLRVLTELGLLEYLNLPELSKKRSSKHPDSIDAEKDYKRLLRSYLQAFNKSLKYSYECYMEQNPLKRSEKLFIEYFLRSYNDEVPTMDREMINLSTVHTAKGLEFPVVFVAGVAQNPKSLSFWDSLLLDPLETHAQSKARLFYVACTRARNLLYIGTNKHFDTLLPNVIKSLTSELPNMKSVLNTKNNLLESLAQDLHRKIPDSLKIKEGKQLYNEFTSLGLLQRKSTNLSQTRQLHTFRNIKPKLYKSLIKFNAFIARR